MLDFGVSVCSSYQSFFGPGSFFSVPINSFRMRLTKASSTAWPVSRSPPPPSPAPRRLLLLSLRALRGHLLLRLRLLLLPGSREPPRAEPLPPALLPLLLPPPLPPLAAA